MRIRTDNIVTIKVLINEYFLLPHGAFIERHLELFCIGEFDGAITHPCSGCRIYISRRAIKHFVESRMRQLSRKDTADALQKIQLIFEAIPDILRAHHHETQPDGKLVFRSQYPIDSRLQYARIILEQRSDSFEIVSIHIRTEKKKRVSRS